MNHRGGEIGRYKFESLGSNSAKIICNNPYPCDFDMGIISAMARRFLPSTSTGVTVEHLESSKCRKTGNDNCSYIVKW